MPRAALHPSCCYNVGVSYFPLQSPFGTIWVHPCPPLDSGPAWARRERLLVDAGPGDAHIAVRGVKIALHAHLFRESGQFRFTDRDYDTVRSDVRSELERLINSFLTREPRSGT